MHARSEDDWNAMIDAWRHSPDDSPSVDPHGLRRRVIAESRRMTINMLLEYAVGLALVGLAAWRLATQPGLDVFLWGFAMLWFTCMALQYSADARRNLWRPASETTAAYLDLALERLRRRDATVRYAWLLLALETALVLGWYPLSWFFWPERFWPLVDRAGWVLGGLCLAVGLLAAWSISVRRRSQAERASLERAARELRELAHDR